MVHVIPFYGRANSILVEAILYPNMEGSLRYLFQSLGEEESSRAFELLGKWNCNVTASFNGIISPAPITRT